MQKDRLNIGILTFPTTDSGNIPLSNLIDILQPISNDIHLVTGNRGYALFKENKEFIIYLRLKSSDLLLSLNKKIKSRRLDSTSGKHYNLPIALSMDEESAFDVFIPHIQSSSCLVKPDSIIGKFGG